jgi:hypothetical protein
MECKNIGEITWFNRARYCRGARKPHAKKGSRDHPLGDWIDVCRYLPSAEVMTLYRNTLLPSAHQAFEVILIAYQSGKTDFTTLISTFRQWHDARATYLQMVNALLGGKVALEQAVRGSLQ